VVALQSLLYGHPALQLFDPATRGALAARLRGILALAADLGAGPLVLGSPRNRTRGARSSAEAFDVAVPFFRALGADAERLGVCLCIEPNPPQYGCDFVTTSAEGIALVREVGSPGFRLHLDTAGMVLAGERPDEAIRAALPWLAHVHLSAPDLGAVGPAAGIDYSAVVRALRAGRYRGLVSIEMRASGDGAERVRRVGDALRFARAELGGAGG
jgi:sugar phosphate isomerase/epimerase